MFVFIHIYLCPFGTQNPALKYKTYLCKHGYVGPNTLRYTTYKTYCQGKPICRQAERSAVRCGVLQCVVANTGWQPIHYRLIMLQCVAVCCGVLQCIAHWCSVLQ